VVNNQHCRTNILERLGVIGWGAYERAIEAFLLLGGSMLMVGSHGEGKSMLAKKLGVALGVSMATYDASKSVWEDIIGFPDPARLMNLELRKDCIGIPRIETPTSIWGKRLLLVDEINRATPEIQSKWLEVILNQTMMGEPTGCKWIISAMNPGYAGTNPLDLALASRYMFFLNAPMGIKMDKPLISKVLELENPEETPAIMTWKTADYESMEVSDEYEAVSIETISQFNEASLVLRSMLGLAANYLPEIQDHWNQSVDEYIITVTKSILSETGMPTDLRRLRMMKNALIAFIALEVPVYGTQPLLIDSNNVKTLASDLLLMSYPVIAGLDGPTREVLTTAHALAESRLEDRKSPRYLIGFEENPIRKLKMLFEFEERDSIITYKTITEVLIPNDAKSRVRDKSHVPFTLAMTLLSAYKAGLWLDNQSMSIINTAISHFNELNTHLGIFYAQPNIANVLEILEWANSGTYAERLSKYTALRINCANSKLDGNSNSVKELLTLVKASQKRIYEFMNSAYKMLLEVTPKANAVIFDLTDNNWKNLNEEYNDDEEIE
jgi:hypothetical protein